MEIVLPEGTPAAFRASTMCEAFPSTVATRGDRVALRTKGDGIAWTWREYGDRVRRYAGGLVGLVLEFIPGTSDVDLSSRTDVVRTIAGFVGGVLLSAFYGAVVGALIVGGRAALRSRRQANTGRQSPPQ